MGSLHRAFGFGCFVLLRFRSQPRKGMMGASKEQPESRR